MRKRKTCDSVASATTRATKPKKGRAMKGGDDEDGDQSENVSEGGEAAMMKM